MIVRDVRLSAASSTASEVLTTVYSLESARPQSCLAIQALLVQCTILLASRCSRSPLLRISAPRNTFLSLNQLPQRASSPSTASTAAGDAPASHTLA